CRLARRSDPELASIARILLAVYAKDDAAASDSIPHFGQAIELAACFAERPGPAGLSSRAPLPEVFRGAPHDLKQQRTRLIRVIVGRDVGEPRATAIARFARSTRPQAVVAQPLQTVSLGRGGG